ncbi:C6 zinc finger domain-containing protein [Colletotrichum cuscutae]|uniref:C6 zinc finger domain-containing protein n=1 Tax=Colletotrichum cuscutae TaxID=1209917 RepID=A0AAI9V928_9PEZI|nr:C6 zinc finger domain-containing protein [Colletotrichum cuscutae]
MAREENQSTRLRIGPRPPPSKIREHGTKGTYPRAGMEPRDFPAIHFGLGRQESPDREGKNIKSDTPRHFPPSFLQLSTSSNISLQPTNRPPEIVLFISTNLSHCTPAHPFLLLMTDPSTPDSHVPSVTDASDLDRSRPEQSTSKTNTRPAARGTAFYQRKRAVRACQVCRARRTKCDNLKPSCSFCLKVGATCIQSPVDLSSFDPASLKILERLDDLEEMMRSVTVDGLPSNKTRVVEAPVEHRTIEAPPVEPLIQMGMILPPRPEHVLSWAIFEEISHGIDAGDMTSHVDHISITTNSPMSLIGALDLEPRRINDLLDSFFSYVHVKNPILDETATRKMVSHTVLEGINWSAESCLSLLICALGSLATPFGPSQETMLGSAAHSDAQAFFQAAQKRLGILLSSDDIIAAQCLFLLVSLSRGY